MGSIDLGAFPDRTGLTHMLWSPVLFRPILGSPEQYVVGVVTVGKGGFHVERANRYDRLNCLHEGRATAAQMAAEAALDVLTADLSERGERAIVEFRPVFSGVVLGEIGETEGHSLEDAASLWMATLSSLYDRRGEVESADLSTFDLADLVAQENREPAGERLPALVLEYIVERNPGLVKFFSSDIRSDTKRRRRNIHGVLIDFAGSRLVANFGTLSPISYAASIDRLKRRLWDLKIDRDKELAGMTARAHELIVFRPQLDDPTLSEKQQSKLTEALGALEDQADQEELRLRPMSSVLDIAHHVLEREAA